MNVAILTLGTRGDVQPYVALGAALKEAGHEVTIVTGKGFGAMVSGRGLRYAALDVDPLELAQSPEGRTALRSPRGALRLARGLMPTVRKMLVDEWEAAASSGADAVVYYPKAMGGRHVAEALGAPGFLALPVPALSPTRAFPVPVLPLPDLGGPLNKLSYGAFFRSITLPYRRMVNRWRKETLGLPALPLSASELELRGEPVVRLYPCSPHVVPVPADWDKSSAMTGYWFLDAGSDWRPPDELAAFLEDGPPPVYVGFGSAAPHPEGSRRCTRGPVEARASRGARHGEVQHGGSRSYRDRGCSPRVVVPADGRRSAPRRSSTTAEGLRAGRPTAVFPSNFGDQLFWGRRVHALGAGPEPVPQKRLTAEGLVATMHAITDDEGMHRRAAALGEKIRAEDGVVRAVEIVAGRTSQESSGP